MILSDRKKKKNTEVDLEKKRVPYTHRASVIKNNHPLSIMVILFGDFPLLSESGLFNATI